MPESTNFFSTSSDSFYGCAVMRLASCARGKKIYINNYFFIWFVADSIEISKTAPIQTNAHIHMHRTPHTPLWKKQLYSVNQSQLEYVCTNKTKPIFGSFENIHIFLLLWWWEALCEVCARCRTDLGERNGGVGTGREREIERKKATTGGISICLQWIARITLHIFALLAARMLLWSCNE